MSVLSYEHAQNVCYWRSANWASIEYKNDATASPQLQQNRKCPHGTSITLSRSSIRHTSHMSSWHSSDSGGSNGRQSGIHEWLWLLASASLSLSSSDVTWKASVWAPRLWLIAFRNCSREYAPLLYLSMHDLVRTPFWMLRFFIGLRISIPCRILSASATLSTVTFWSSVIFWVLHFSSPAIWSVIFWSCILQLLKKFWSVISWSCKFSTPTLLKINKNNTLKITHHKIKNRNVHKQNKLVTQDNVERFILDYM